MVRCPGQQSIPWEFPWAERQSRGQNGDQENTGIGNAGGSGGNGGSPGGKVKPSPGIPGQPQVGIIGNGNAGGAGGNGGSPGGNMKPSPGIPGHPHVGMIGSGNRGGSGGKGGSPGGKVKPSDGNGQLLMAPVGAMCREGTLRQRAGVPPMRARLDPWRSTPRPSVRCSARRWRSQCRSAETTRCHQVTAS